MGELLTVRDVARTLKVSARQVRKLAAAGRIPKPVKLGRSTRWRKSDIDDFLRAGGDMRVYYVIKVFKFLRAVWPVVSLLLAYMSS